MQEIKLNIPQFHTVTRSFSKKVQVKQFEPIEAFSSHSEQIPLNEATSEKIKEVSNKLFQMAQEEVETSCRNKLAEAESLKEVGLSTEELTGISTHIQMINEGASSNELKVVIEKDKLNDKQVDFLRKYFMIANSNG